MESNFGKVTKETDGFKVRFERILNHDILTVWEAITHPDKLKIWFTDINIEAKVGGKITIRFRDETQTASYGEVICIDPPHRFEFMWEGELAVWELSKMSENKCKLNFTYSKIDESYAVNVPSGFHTLLDRLASMLAGNTATYAFGTEENNPDIKALQKRYSDVIYKNYPELEKLEPIIVEKTYNAPIEKVWKALTDKDQMKQWYFDIPDFKPEVGFEFQFKGQGHKGEQYLHLCKITEVEPLKKLAHSWCYDGYEGYSTVSFELFTEGGKTTLRLTHNGLHTFPINNPDFAKESFQGGWTSLITNLLADFLTKN